MSDMPKIFECPKCGNVVIKMKYLVDEDKLRCGCERCYYTWTQEPLDKSTGDGGTIGE